MTKSEILAHFGSQHKLSRLLNVRQAAICEWTEDEVPGHFQLIIERITNGELQASSDAYRDVIDRVHSATRGLIRLSARDIQRRLKNLRVCIQLCD